MTRREFNALHKVEERQRIMSPTQYRRDFLCHVPQWVVDPLAARKPGWARVLLTWRRGREELARLLPQ